MWGQPLPIHPVVVAGNWHLQYVNNSGIRANDFHICGVIGALDNYQPMLQSHMESGGVGPWYLEEYTIEKVADHPINWYFTAHFKTNYPIPSGTVMHFGLKFLTNYCNKAVVNCAYWTNYKEAVGRAYPLSFNIYRQQGLPRVALINTTGQPMVLANVEFAVSRQAIKLEAMYTEGLGNPGETGGLSKELNLAWQKADRLADLKTGQIVIESDKPLDFDLAATLGIKLNVGEFLLIRGYTISQGQKLPWWLQHEESGQ